MYYKITNNKTGSVLKLSYNSTSIDDVRESILIYISLDKDIINFTETNIAVLLVEANLSLAESNVPFDELPVAFNNGYVPHALQKERYVPKGRISCSPDFSK